MTIMVKDWALPERGDKVMVDFGYPIGPFATADLSGLDIGYDSRQRRAAQIPNYRKMPIADAIVEAGRLGQKTGPAGFVARRATDSAPRPRGRPHHQGKGRRDGRRAAQLHRRGDPATAALRVRQRGLQDPRGGQAYRASDVDVMSLNGFGFPRYRGGLM
jgi:3-hydroxyacyl-CoA dehydrogenase